ncbi:response regulator transcription factor [Streptomyces canus]|uniref:response regulator transcription factor n=1 Tax=Streptomyces canus TaxID=58343 RepID=UPI0036E423CA
MCTFTDYDVLILDRDLPVMTGNEVCSRLNERTDPPRILMLTATEDIRDKVYCLEQLGTDDYLAEPFDFAELVARVRALSRRAPKPPPIVLQLGGIVLDHARPEVELVRAVLDENLNPPHQRGPCHRQPTASQARQPGRRHHGHRRGLLPVRLSRLRQMTFRSRLASAFTGLFPIDGVGTARLRRGPGPVGSGAAGPEHRSGRIRLRPGDHGRRAPAFRWPLRLLCLRARPR